MRVTSSSFSSTHTYGGERVPAMFVVNSGCGRSLDLSPYLHKMGLDWCKRTADRWGFAIGNLKPYRRKASFRRWVRSLSRKTK